MKTLFKNAKVYVDKGHFEQAVLVENDRIIAVGSEETVGREESVGSEDAITQIDSKYESDGSFEDLATLEDRTDNDSKNYEFVANEDLKVIDCGGRTLIPSFADSHMHLFGLALNLSQAKIVGARSAGEIVDICRAFAAENPERVKKGLYSAGWNQDLFVDEQDLQNNEGQSSAAKGTLSEEGQLPKDGEKLPEEGQLLEDGERLPEEGQLSEKKMPSIDDADAISTEFPVCLERTCGHIVVCNHRLLEMMEEEGHKLTEEQRRTGIFTEGDVKAPKELVTRFTKEELAELVIDAMKRCASFGLSSVASNDAEFVFKDHDLVEGALDLIFKEGRAPIRYRQQISFESVDAFKKAFAEGAFSNEKKSYHSESPNEKVADSGEINAYHPESPNEKVADSGEINAYHPESSNKKIADSGEINAYHPESQNENIEECKERFSKKGTDYNTGWFTNGPLKLFADGSLGARTAHLRAGYADDPDNHGIETSSREELKEYCLAAKEAGLQVVTHGIGDGAVEKIIDVYEEVFGPENPMRCAIIHCQVTDEELIQRIASLNIPAMVQPIFLDYDIMIAEDRCGTELAGTSYAFRSLAENGHMSFGTDCPVEDCNPFDGLYSAVTRKRMDGTPEGGWFPHECMDVAGAIDAYTKETAYIEFAEDCRGRIKEGFAADMVLLDRDIFTVPADEIKDVRPVMTMTGGRVTFRAEGFES